MVRAPIIKEGYGFIAAAFLLALVVGYALSPYAAVVPTVLAGFFMFFFRNPSREIPVDSSVVVSPADGKVMDIVPVESGDFVADPGM